MAKRKTKSKYPEYPGSGMDYAVIHSASTMLRKPNKVICIYCRHQAVTEAALTHEPDCPARNDYEPEPEETEMAPAKTPSPDGDKTSLKESGWNPKWVFPFDVKILHHDKARIEQSGPDKLVVTFANSFQLIYYRRICGWRVAVDVFTRRVPPTANLITENLITETPVFVNADATAEVIAFWEEAISTMNKFKREIADISRDTMLCCILEVFENHPDY